MKLYEINQEIENIFEQIVDPEIKKGEVKALLTAGKEVPGAELEEAVHCSLK